MAFGDLRGTLGTNAVSITNPFNATGSVVVSVGDLVFAVLSEQTTLTVTGVTDNLGNTYTAQNAGTDAGNGTGRAFYSRVTVAGTLTTVAAACTASTDNAAFAVAVFAGPFLAPPIDANPANLSNDTTTPFTCPATGTLSQSAELVVGWIGSNGSGTAYTAVSPNVLAAQQISSTVATAVIGAQVVSATTSISPAFATSVPTSNVLGTASFKQDTSVVVPPSGYFMQFGAAAVAVAAIATQATSFAVPANPSNTITGTGWYQQLSSAPPVAQAQQGLSVVPFNTAQIAQAAPNPSGWRSQSPVAVKVAQANPTQTTAFAVPANPSNSITGIGWYQPLSNAAPVAKAQAGNSFVPFNTAQTVASNPSGWQTIQSSAPSRAVINGSALTFVVAPFTVPNNSTTTLEWQQPLSVKPSLASAIPTQPSGFAVPPSVTSTPTPGQFGWYTPLSVAVPVAKAQQGNSFVPFDTVQVAVGPQTIGVPLTWDASAPGATQVYYQASFAPLAPLAAPQNTVTQLAWQQPLSIAPKLAQAAPSGSTFVPLNTAQLTNHITSYGWYVPLSKAAPVAQAKVGSSFVPFDTVQVTPPPPPPATDIHSLPFLNTVGRFMTR